MLTGAGAGSQPSRQKSARLLSQATVSTSLNLGFFQFKKRKSLRHDFIFENSHNLFGFTQASAFWHLDCQKGFTQH